jgi:hypothetical protein
LGSNLKEKNMSTISAGTTVGTALVNSGDTTGNLVIKTGANATTALTISGTDQSATFAGAVSFSSNAFAAGSASAPSITFTGDTNTGIFSPGADTIGFAEGGTEVMRIDANGNVGIGTTSIASGGAGTVNFNVNTPSSNTVYFKLSNAATGNTASDGFDLLVDSSGNAYAYNRENANLLFGTNATERMRIANNGAIGIGGANYGSSGQVLTSGGSGAAPSWASLPAGGVTSLNGQTGAITNTDLYAIGSYVSARPQNATNYANNTTIAGSSLYTNNMSAYYNPSSGVPWQGAALNANGVLINTGTWRCMSAASGDGNYGAMGLWVRIS